MNNDLYIEIVSEIFDGYSKLELPDKNIFVRHFRLSQQRTSQIIFNKAVKTASKRGVLTEEEAIIQAKKDDIWTGNDERELTSLSFEISNLEKSVKSIFLPSQKERFQKEIKDKKQHLLLKEQERKKIIGSTAEDYANMRVVEYLILSSCFCDPELTQPAFTKLDIDEMDDTTLYSINTFISAINTKISDANIQQAVLKPFFSLYLSSCDNMADFFGKPIIDLSIFQLKLCSYGRLFHSIFQYIDDIPDSIRENPEQLLSFSESKRSNKSDKFIKEDADASVVFGAQNKDLENLKDNKSKQISLSELLASKEGKLSMNDFIDLAEK